MAARTHQANDEKFSCKVQKYFHRLEAQPRNADTSRQHALKRQIEMSPNFEIVAASVPCTTDVQLFSVRSAKLLDGCDSDDSKQVRFAFLGNLTTFLSCKDDSAMQLSQYPVHSISFLHSKGEESKDQLLCVATAGSVHSSSNPETGAIKTSCILWTYCMRVSPLLGLDVKLPVDHAPISVRLVSKVRIGEWKLSVASAMSVSKEIPHNDIISQTQEESTSDDVHCNDFRSQQQLFSVHCCSSSKIARVVVTCSTSTVFVYCTSLDSPHALHTTQRISGSSSVVLACTSVQVCNNICVVATATLDGEVQLWESSVKVPNLNLRAKILPRSGNTSVASIAFGSNVLSGCARDSLDSILLSVWREDGVVTFYTAEGAPVRHVPFKKPSNSSGVSMSLSGISDKSNGRQFMISTSIDPTMCCLQLQPWCFANANIECPAKSIPTLNDIACTESIQVQGIKFLVDSIRLCSLPPTSSNQETHHTQFSGAAHLRKLCHINDNIPTAMVFVPSNRGLEIVVMIFESIHNQTDSLHEGARVDSTVDSSCVALASSSIQQRDTQSIGSESSHHANKNSSDENPECNSNNSSSEQIESESPSCFVAKLNLPPVRANDSIDHDARSVFTSNSHGTSQRDKRQALLESKLRVLHNRVGNVESDLRQLRNSFEVFTNEITTTMAAIHTTLQSLPSPVRPVAAELSAKEQSNNMEEHEINDYTS